MDFQKNNNQIIKGRDVMDSQNNNNQIITEKWPLDKIETDKKEISEEISNLDKQLKIMELFAQGVKDGIISIDYYNEHPLDPHGHQKRMKEIERNGMENKIAYLQMEKDELRERLKNLQAENDDFRERWKKYENKILELENISRNINAKIGLEIWEAKCGLSDKILECKFALEDQFLYMKKYIENNEKNENNFMKLFGLIIGASWGLILMALFQIFLFHR